MSLLLSFSLLLSIFQSPSDHALYLSTFQLTISDDTIKGEIKVFEDDFRDALRGFRGSPIDTASADFRPLADAYFDKNIQILNYSEQLAFNVIDINKVGDSYHISYSCEQFEKINELTFKVDYFLELFPTQQNVLHVKCEDKQWYHIFKKGKEELSLNISS